VLYDGCVTPPVSFDAGRHGAAAVLVAPRRGRRKEHGTPPGAPPRDRDGDGDGGSDGAAPAGGADGVGFFALALALAGITTLFVVLIAVWLFLRRPATDWRGAEAAGALDALWLSTVCLAASSAAVELAARRARDGAPARRATLRWLATSLALGLAFLAAQVWLWIGLWHAGLVPSASGYAAVFFTLTGLHALHVLGGLGFLGALAVWLRRRARELPSVRLGALYWHFMGALWLVLFSLLYFVR
jgi:cytochrome c oxidase subunit 3